MPFLEDRTGVVCLDPVEGLKDRVQHGRKDKVIGAAGFRSFDIAWVCVSKDGELAGINVEGAAKVAFKTTTLGLLQRKK